MASAVRSWRTSRPRSYSRTISGASCSPCCIGRSESARRTTSSPSWRATVTSGVAVSKASSIRARTAGRAVGGEPAVVTEQVEGERRRDGLPDRGVGLGVERAPSRRTRRRPAVRPAKVVAQIVWAWPTRVATTWGARTTQLRDSARLSRIGAIRPRPRLLAGGAGRRTSAGRPPPAARRASRAGRPAPPGRSARPSVGGTSESSIRTRRPRRRSASGSAVGARSRGRGRTPRGRRGCRCRQPGPGRARGRPAPRRTPPAVPWSATSPVTTRTSGRGSSASRCASDRFGPGPRVGRAAEWVSLTCAMNVVIRAPGRSGRASAARPA